MIPGNQAQAGPGGAEAPTLEERFSYSRINAAVRENQSIVADGFMSQANSQEGHDYIDFMYFEVDNDNAEKSDSELIYIAIDAAEDENIQKAWDAILPVLIQHKVYGVKVLKAGSPQVVIDTLRQLSSSQTTETWVIRESHMKTIEARWASIIRPVVSGLPFASVGGVRGVDDRSPTPEILAGAPDPDF